MSSKEILTAPGTAQSRCLEMIVSLRKITQAIALHSKDLNRRYGLTGPQLSILTAIANHDQISVSELARCISVSQATVTDILNRLEGRGLVEKQRGSLDRRRVTVSITATCQELLQKAPPPLQEEFIERFVHLPEWEQMMIVSAFKLVEDLMSAQKLEAAPILSAASFPQDTFMP
jgi:DNA-binding MarR family transcriptional regulator